MSRASEGPGGRGERNLGPERWEPFLRMLDEDEEMTQERLKLLRERLEKYFEYRSPAYLNSDPRTMADQTIIIVAAKTETGAVEQGKLQSFALGVARNVLYEEIRKYRKTVEVLAEIRRRLDFPGREKPRDHECLEAALGSLDDEDRIFIEDYYGIEKKTTTQRTRACGIVKRLRHLYQDCCNRKGSTK